MKYQTKQKELILNILKNHEGKFYTAKELLKLLQNQVSKATLYRCVDELYQENVIKRYYNEISNSYEYQYLNNSDDCNHHLHLKCNKCGKIFHIFDKISTNLFLIDYHSSIINGVCNICSNKI